MAIGKGNSNVRIIDINPVACWRLRLASVYVTLQHFPSVLGKVETGIMMLMVEPKGAAKHLIDGCGDGEGWW